MGIDQNIEPLVDRPPSLIGIMRHGRVKDPMTAADLATIELRSDADGSERAELTQLGRALAEVLDGQPDPMDRFVVIHEPTDHARLTAEALTFAYNEARRLQWPTAPRAEMLGPTGLGEPSPYGDSRAVRSWIDRWKTATRVSEKAAGTDRTFLLQVGHDPRMSMLAHAVIRGRSVGVWRRGSAWLVDRFRPPVPALNHTEMLVSKRNSTGRYRAHWTLGPTDNKTDTALREKVKSKMNTAKVFAGVLTAVTAFAADNVKLESGTDRALALAGLALFGLSIVLYLITMFFYDSLLMPRRFWTTAVPLPHGRSTKAAVTPSSDRSITTNSSLDDRLLRPPSSGTVVLFQNMVLVWSRVFVPATFLAGLGLVLFVEGAAELPSWPYHIAFWLGAAALALAAIGIGHWGRPRLGTQD